MGDQWEQFSSQLEELLVLTLSMGSDIWQHMAWAEPKARLHRYQPM